jgi:DNA-binding NtrC family response regulator
MMGGRILAVDDEKDMLALLRRIISEDTDHELTTESDPLQALERFKAEPFDLVISDLKMPKMDGLRLLEAIRQHNPQAAVILMTAYGTIETAVEATRKGAQDFITKPFRRERILVTVEKVIQWQQVARENERLREALAHRESFASLIGGTPIMKEVFERIRQVAPTQGTVLITGPSGTGKELVARAIHQYSQRRDKRLITVNCTAIPENVLESELFGHVRGAFTGAWKDKNGLVAEADGGTLFLDEIGDLSPLMQTKLLRLLQEGEYKPVGSVVTHKADIRFIAATNHNLKTAIRERTFREDLYYRLNVIHFDLPPLRERKDDIPLLAYHFLNRYAQANQKPIEEISPVALQALMARDYPGNVRELENIIERGVIYCRGKTLTVKDLLLDSERETAMPELEMDMARLPFKDAKDRMMQMFHQQYIEALLREHGGNISRAAETAGIQRQYLHRLIKETGIDTDTFKEKA